MARGAVRVLMVLESHYPIAGGGGAEGQVRTLSAALRSRGHRVTILTPLSPLGPRQRVSRVDHVPVCRIDYPKLRLVGGPVLWLRTAAFLIQRRNRYDAWHVHIAHRMAAVCALIGPWLRIPVLVKPAGSWDFSHVFADRPTWTSRVAHRCLMRTDIWLAISQSIARRLRGLGVPVERIRVIPNAVDTHRFSTITPTRSRFLRFVFVGRLVPEKNLDVLLEAFAEAFGERPDVRLRLVGHGPLREALAVRASELGIGDQVCFDGHLDDVSHVLGHADVALLPSLDEGLSNSLLEYMSAGLPSIVSRVSGSEDLIRHRENGWVCEPGDRDTLVECLLDAASINREQRRAMGHVARATVEAYSGRNSVVDRLLPIYRGDEPYRATGANAQET